MAVATLVAIGASALMLLALTGREVEILEIKRETPQQWLEGGALRWAAVNGAALGIGATSRIGFWLWYVIPLGAFLLGDPSLSGMIVGVYGATRGFAAWLAIALIGDQHDLTDWLLARNKQARIIGSRYLLALGLMGIVAIGF